MFNKKGLKFLSLLGFMIILTGCADTNTENVSTSSASLEVPAPDHHADEENVEPHGHDETVEPHDDAGLPPHGHDDSEDHHEGEENVEEHGHETAPHDDTGLPPHRD